jgi:programmed cell death 6-interacting protein
VLEASVPSTTGSSAAQSTPQAQLTRDHARALRVKLEDLASLHDEREQLVHRARSIAAVDDIRPRIMEASAGFEQLSKVTPDMFQDIADEELAKFDRFLSEMDDVGCRQNELLREIQVCAVHFSFYQ